MNARTHGHIYAIKIRAFAKWDTKLEFVSPCSFSEPTKLKILRILYIDIYTVCLTVFH